MKNYVVIGLIIILVLAGIVVYENYPTKKSIYVVSMTADEMSASLKNGTIAGFIIWEPYPSKAVSEGYGRRLVNSKDIWENHPSCDLAISEDLKDEDMIKALVWTQIKGTRFINNHSNQEKVLQYGQEFSGLDRTIVLAAINNTIYTEFPDINQTKKGIEILYKAGAFKNTMASMGYDNVDEFLSNLIIDKYYKEVKKMLEEDPGWTPPTVNGSLRFGYTENNIHHLAMYIAQKEGYFERVGLIPGKNVQFTGYRSGRALTDAFKHREVDAADLGTIVIIRYSINENGRLNIVNGVNTAGSSLVVRADSDIKSLDDLNGHIIATTGFVTCQDTIMRKMFERFEISSI